MSKYFIKFHMFLYMPVMLSITTSNNLFHVYSAISITIFLVLAYYFKESLLISYSGEKLYIIFFVSIALLFCMFRLFQYCTIYEYVNYSCGFIVNLLVLMKVIKSKI
jgi:hypothetical protein